MKMGESVRIELLGGLRVSRGGLPLTGFATRKVPVLLAYLASTGTPQPREQLATLLWGESSDDAARGSLRQALANLNRLLGEILIITRTTVGIRPDAPLWCDVDALKQAARRGADLDSLHAAVELYAGDFLAGVAISDAPAFEEWALAQRARLRDLALDALRRLAAQQAAQGDYYAAVTTLRRLLALEPWHEEAHRQLMGALARSGQRSLALAQYVTCRRLLAAELGVEPTVETTALYEQILQRRLAADPRETRAPAEPPPPVAPPAAQPTARPRHNLPAPATSFVGRDDALAALRSLLAPEGSDHPRLLTLTGVGGSGKSSLALRAAAAQVAVYADGVWLVELVDLADAALIDQSLASLFAVLERQGQPLRQAVIETLRDRRLLLLLDNCEHLLDECGRLVAALLRACPGVTILATSRQPLGLPGERRWPVPTLAVDAGAGDDPGQPPPAVELFVARARAVRPDFRPDAQELRTVAEVCRRLDGLPLAIELAAARCIAMSPGEIAARLEDRFRLLVSVDASVSSHQRTLAATLDWSHDLLAPDERTLLRRLAAFAGGWMLEACEAVCADDGDDGLRPWDILDLLVRLITKSLVQVEAQPQGGTRYRLLETVRQYAAQRLAASPDATAVRARHAAHFLALAEATAPHLTGPDQAARLERLDHDLDNLRAALSWARDAGEAAITLRLAGTVARFWHERGYLAEGRGWLEEALARARGAEVPAAVTAQALYMSGVLANALGDQEAAVRRVEESIAVYRAVGDRVGTARALNTLGGVAFDLGEMAAAARDFTDCLELLRAEHDPGEVARALGNLGEAHYHLGDLDRAAACYGEALALAATAGRRDVEAYVLGDLGDVARLRGELRRAAEHYRRALELKWALGSRRQSAIGLEDLAALAAALDQGERAAGLLGAAIALRTSIGSPQPVPERHATERAVAAVRAALGEAAWAAAFAAGESLPLPQAIADAIAWALAMEAALPASPAEPQASN